MDEARRMACAGSPFPWRSRKSPSASSDAGVRSGGPSRCRNLRNGRCSPRRRLARRKKGFPWRKRVRGRRAGAPRAAGKVSRSGKRGAAPFAAHCARRGRGPCREGVICVGKPIRDLEHCTAILLSLKHFIANLFVFCRRTALRPSAASAMGLSPVHASRVRGRPGGNRAVAARARKLAATIAAQPPGEAAGRLKMPARGCSACSESPAHV